MPQAAPSIGQPRPPATWAALAGRIGLVFDSLARVHLFRRHARVRWERRAQARERRQRADAHAAPAGQATLARRDVWHEQGRQQASEREEHGLARGVIKFGGEQRAASRVYTPDLPSVRPSVRGLGWHLHSLLRYFALDLVFLGPKSDQGRSERIVACGRMDMLCCSPRSGSNLLERSGLFSRNDEEYEVRVIVWEARAVATAAPKVRLPRRTSAHPALEQCCRH